MSPELLILDEPIAGLDPLVQQSFHALLAEVSGSRTDGLLVLAHALGGRACRAPTSRSFALDAWSSSTRCENLRESSQSSGSRSSSATPVAADEFRALPGVREVQAAGHGLTIVFEGSADAVIKAAAQPRGARGPHAHEDDLEDIFLRYYRGESAR